MPNIIFWITTDGLRWLTNYNGPYIHTDGQTDDRLIPVYEPANAGDKKRMLNTVEKK